MAKRKKPSSVFYERKLPRVMERLGIKEGDWNYNFDRFGCFVEFRLEGQLYRFDHSKENAEAHGVKDVKTGIDAFGQVTLSLEDLARMAERGIYRLSVWIAGMKFLPPPLEVPSFFKFLGFKEIPTGPKEVTNRYRELAKQMHPDAGGSTEDMKKLIDACEKSVKYFGKAGSGE